MWTKFYGTQVSFSFYMLLAVPKYFVIDKAFSYNTVRKTENDETQRI